ncbi:MAG: hypothetical protein ACJ76D_08400 [Solirubrobacterales bacterium]
MSFGIELQIAIPHPEEFVLNLNQLITTLRQVTFMLQTQKTKISGFEEWYEVGWREDQNNYL